MIQTGILLPPQKCYWFWHEIAYSLLFAWSIWRILSNEKKTECQEKSSKKSDAGSNLGGEDKENFEEQYLPEEEEEEEEHESDDKTIEKNLEKDLMIGEVMHLDTKAEEDRFLIFQSL